MIKQFLTFVIVLIGVQAELSAQNRKINLAEHLPLAEVLAKAKAEKKHVLLDFGSPKCGPCLFLKKSVFTIDSVADFANERFVAVDYQLGDEKKRLSKMYGVVGEPVLLILDSDGKLMHKMVGKCNPDQLIARFKQGLDVNNNLIAQNARYAKGDKSSTFLLSYLETLFIASEVKTMNAVLKEVFNVPVEKLKEKTYWDIFVRYNEDPMSREMQYVFDNRKMFYELFGKTAVESKIDRHFSAKASYYIFGHSAPAKEKEFTAMLSYLQKTDYEKATEWLTYLVPAQYKFTDWVAMAHEINNVLAFNIVKGPRKESFMKMMSEQFSWYSEDKKALPYAVKWIDALLALSTTDAETRESLKGTRADLIKKINSKDFGSASL